METRTWSRADGEADSVNDRPVRRRWTWGWLVACTFPGEDAPGVTASVLAEAWFELAGGVPELALRGLPGQAAGAYIVTMPRCTMPLLGR